MRERLINRRQQGDLGEASAIEWLTSKGARVWCPLGHSPDIDLLAEIDNDLLRVQVKTSTYGERASDGRLRYAVQLATNGGNQSWTGVTKRLDRRRIDYLFVLVGDGRRWFIPAEALDSTRTVRLGGPKYSEFEAESGTAIQPLVYGSTDPTLKSTVEPGECPSGQREHAVNVPAMPTQVRILPPPSGRLSRPKYERNPGRLGQAVVWDKRRITIPLRPFDEAGLSIGDRMRVRADGPGRLILERIEAPGNTLFT
jgi:PD-(D/E)XK endonuclease